MRMILQDSIDILGVVLAAQRQNEPSLLVVEQTALEFHVHVARIVGAQRNTVDSVLADDAAPERVVGVECYDLGFGKLAHDSDYDDSTSHLGGSGGRERKSGRVPQS